MSMSLPVPVPMATGGWRARVQRFGGFLAGMVIPNIGAILAWGLLTAFVIPTGWTPNAKLAQMVGPLITFLLPILAFWAIGPAVTHASNALGDAVNYLVKHTLLPLVSIIVEPAKVLFLNNAINHGVLAPLGVAKVAKHGKAIEFMIESNPGPGLGLLTAYWFFGPRSIRPSAPGAIIIHFFGGIHEVYFPYVLMRPILIVGMIAGGMAGVLTFLVTHAGLVATPSPGSIFAYLAETPKGGYFGVLAGVAVGAIVSFLVNSFLLKLTVREDEYAEEEVARAETAPAPATA